MNNIGSRLKRLEERVGVKNLTESSKQILNIGGYDEDNLFDYIIYPLYKFWNIEDPGFDTTEFLDLTDLAQAKTPAGYDPEDTFFIDVQKFAKLVTKEFVKRDLIGREFLNKSLPRFEVPEVEPKGKKLSKRVISKTQIIRLINYKKLIQLGFENPNWGQNDLEKETSKGISFIIGVFTSFGYFKLTVGNQVYNEYWKQKLIPRDEIIYEKSFNFDPTSEESADESLGELYKEAIKLVRKYK